MKAKIQLCFAEKHKILIQKDVKYFKCTQKEQREFSTSKYTLKVILIKSAYFRQIVNDYRWHL